MKFNLERFREAQENNYETALREIKNGKKQSHWMWYIFPQLKGLGYSPMAKYYAIENKKEAEAYIRDDELRERLIEISEALLSLECSNPSRVMGYPDDLKLQSSMTLFAITAPDIDVFEKVLDKFYRGEKDENTVELLKEE